MTKSKSGKRLFDAVSDILNDPEKLADIHTDMVLPTNLLDWFNRLRVLHGVPFDYLVPDARMLPSESISFFQVDYNWIYAILEGALSIGTSTSSNGVTDKVVKPNIYKAIFNSDKEGEDDVETGPVAPEQVSGFLLRSQVVKGWPGLEVVPYDKDNNELTSRYRMERLSPNLLLYMVEGIIDHVDLREPPEGMHFGVNIVPGNTDVFKKAFRYVTVPSTAPDGTLPGDEIMPIKDNELDVPLRSKRVIKIDKLAKSVKAALYTRNANNNPDGTERPFTSAEFGLEITEGSQAVLFKSG